MPIEPVNITPEQLETLGTLMRADKGSVAYLSAKMVLVEGKSLSCAAKELSAKPNTVHNGVKRYKERMKM